MTGLIARSLLNAIPLEVGGRQVLAHRRPNLGPGNGEILELTAP